MVQQIAVILQHEIQSSKTEIYIASFQMTLELGYFVNILVSATGTLMILTQFCDPYHGIPPGRGVGKLFKICTNRFMLTTPHCLSELGLNFKQTMLLTALGKVGPGLWVLDCGSWIVGPGLWVSKLQVPPIMP